MAIINKWHVKFNNEIQIYKNSINFWIMFLKITMIFHKKCGHIFQLYQNEKQTLANSWTKKHNDLTPFSQIFFSFDRTFIKDSMRNTYYEA